MGFNVMAFALSGFLLLSFTSLQAQSEENLNVESPAASRVDESIIPSSGGYSELVNRKLLVRDPALTEVKVEGRAENSRWRKHSDVHDRDLASKKVAGIGNEHQLTGKQAPFIRTSTSGIQVVGNNGLAEAQSKLQITTRTSLKSFPSSLFKKLNKRTSLLEVSMKQKISDSTINADSNTSPEISQPFSASRSTDTDDDTAEITRMDYTPAQRRPPIHNKSAP